MVKCNTCGKEIEGLAVSSPSIDFKKRTRCLDCAEKDINAKSLKAILKKKDELKELLEVFKWNK